MLSHGPQTVDVKRMNRKEIFSLKTVPIKARRIETVSIKARRIENISLIKTRVLRIHFSLIIMIVSKSHVHQPVSALRILLVTIITLVRF